MRQTDGNTSCHSQSDCDSHKLVDHFFRHEYARTVSVLCRQFGLKYLETAEDSVQKALLSAMQNWPHHGTPDSPSAWITRAAKNRMIDSLRHNKTTEIIHHRLLTETTSEYNEEVRENNALSDSLLQMMFVCCHPALDFQSQIALSLKTLCGFSVSEIASGLFMKSETVKKRLQRARAKLKSLNVELQQPHNEELSSRLHALHHVLYLMFNEGYSTSSGEAPIRDDICEEATYLCYLLANHQVATPATYALLALMLLHSARLESRFDEHGLVLMLDEQDRSTWDQTLIQEGIHWLQKASIPSSRYHLEAYLAMQHVAAANIEQTRWPVIIELYDQLIATQDSPVYRLNRAIAVAFNGQHNEAVDAIRLLKTETFNDYYLLYCALGKIYELNQNFKRAIDHYTEALNHTDVAHQKETINCHIEKLKADQDK